MWVWERLQDEDETSITHRMQVPGGWALRTVSSMNSADGGIAVHIVFIPYKGE